MIAEVLALVLIWLIGVLTGAVGILLLGKIMLRRASLKKLKSSTDNTESVESRMKKVKELTAEQLELQSQTFDPQKNSLHGRYKNGLNERIKELEDNKNAILRSIIADGFDPEINVMDSTGTISTIKLSEYLTITGATETVTPVKVKSQTKQVGKFTVVKGGKDDGGTLH